MEKEIYLSVMEALLSLQDSDGEALVKYIDLWNRNVEFIDQEAAWERPAVFVEFAPLTWEHVKAPVDKSCSMRSRGLMRLHIVTDWHGGASSSELPSRILSRLGRMDLCNEIVGAVTGLSGETFSDMKLSESSYSHDHEEIVEDLATFRYMSWREW